MSSATTRGVVFVHSAPPALCPHVEWAAGAVLGVRLHLDWTGQPAEPGSLRTELSWLGAPGTGARLASALRGWDRLRYEVTEEPSAGADGARWSHTPSLGVHHAVVGVHGDVLVHEDRVRAAIAAAGGDARALTDELDRVLGRAWDAELEPFRYAGDGAPVRWLHRVG
jgi:hypothetical protein